MNHDNVCLRRLRDDINDYKLLENWYQEEEIYSQFEQRKLNFQEIKEKYYPENRLNSISGIMIIWAVQI